MTADAIAVLESTFTRLARESLSGAVLAGAVWGACRALPALPASARAMLWWVVSLKLLVGLAWVAPVSLPILPADDLLPAAMRHDASFAASTLASVVVPDRALEATPTPAAVPALSWQAKAAALWIIGLLAISIRFAWQLRRWNATSAQAEPSSDERQSTVRALARLMGVARAPVVYDSDDVETPMLVGLFRPRIVVPRDRFEALTVAEQRMALCHELAHHRRADLWLGIVPALAERVFFFHPLARLAAREYLVAREAACDAAVVEAIGVSAHDYGRLLLTLGVSPVDARFAAAGTSRTFSNLKRRILMLGLPTPTRKVQTAGWLMTGLAAMALVPVQLVGRAQLVDVPSTAAADLTPESAATAAQASNTAREAVVRENEISYAIMYGDSSIMMSGRISSSRLDRLRGNDARLFWFEIGGREYVVRDPAGIDRALAVTKAVREIGAAQGEVGSKQGAIGAQQGEVGAKQGAIGAQQGQIGAKQGAIGAKQAALAVNEIGATDAERRQLDRQRAELDAEMRKLDAEMRVLDQQMREADQPMADLDAKMRVLDDEMRVLDGKMHEAEKKMEVEMRQLIEKLIAEKVAQPL
jgi:beta-lactamase regulating signal transducer with metallopeptidase domain